MSRYFYNILLAKLVLGLNVWHTSPHFNLCLFFLAYLHKKIWDINNIFYKSISIKVAEKIVNPIIEWLENDAIFYVIEILSIKKSSRSVSIPRENLIIVFPANFTVLKNKRNKN